MNTCERCGKDATEGSRFCRGHRYVGERYVSPKLRTAPDEDAEIASEGETKKDSLLALVRRRLGW